MTISIHFLSWLEDKRKIFHVLPGIMVDYRELISIKKVTFVLTWLFWSIGISFRIDD